MDKHGVEIGGFAVHSSGKRVVVCANIDNLLKGAATQCLREYPFPFSSHKDDCRHVLTVAALVQRT